MGSSFLGPNPQGAAAAATAVKAATTATVLATAEPTMVAAVSAAPALKRVAAEA